MLRTTLGPLQLECCVYNASGPRTGSTEALAKIGGSRSGAVLSKSATLVKQDGNPMPRAIAAVDLGAALLEALLLRLQLSHLVTYSTFLIS